MAEVLAVVGIVSNICSIIEFSKFIIEACSHYYDSARTAKEDILSIASTVNALKIVLENLQKLGDRFKSLDSNQAYSPFLRCLDGNVRQCEEAMKALGAEMGVDFEESKDKDGIRVKRFQKLQWPLKENQVGKHVRVIESIKNTIDIILTSITVAQNRAMGEGIEEINARIVEMTEEIATSIADDRTNEKISAWLKENAPDSSSNYRTARKKCTAKTGDWLAASSR
jgi:Fungal N-terminal domain of STAND proteins